MRLNSFIKINRLFRFRSLKDISGLWLSQIMAALSAFLTQFMLVRMLTVEEYGSFSTAITFTGIIASLAGFGVGSYWLRIFGKEGWTGFRWINNTLKLALFSIVFSLVILLCITLAVDMSVSTKILMLFFSTIIVSQGLATLAYSIYQLEGNYKHLALFQFLTHGLRLIVVLLAWIFGKSLLMVGLGYLVASLIQSIVYAHTTYRMYKKEIHLKDHDWKEASESRDLPTFLMTFKNSWPYSLSGVFYLIYFQSNVFLLSRFIGEEASGIYNVALTVLTVIYLFPSTIYQGYLLPKIHRWAEHDKQKITTIYHSGGKMILILGVLLMIGLSSTALWIIPLLFGDEFIVSGYVLIILSASIPIRLLGNNLASILVTENNMVKKVLYQGIGAAVNVLLNLGMIPVYGVYGAAVSTVFTEFFVTLLFIYGAKKHIAVIKTTYIENKYRYLVFSLICMVLPLAYLVNIYFTSASVAKTLLLTFSSTVLFLMLVKTFANEKGISAIFKAKA